MLSKFKLELIDGWKDARKMSSVRFAAAFAVLSGMGPFIVSWLSSLAESLPMAWATVPDEMKHYFPENAHKAIAYAIFFLTIIGARVTQRKRPPCP